MFISFTSTLDRIPRNSERVQEYDAVLRGKGDGLVQRRRVLPHQVASQANETARTRRQVQVTKKC